MCGLFLFIPSNVMATTNMIQMDHKTNVPVDKVWSIKFNQEINKDSINNIIIKDSEGKNVNGISLSYDSTNETVKVQPPALGYKKGQTYSIHIYATVKDMNNNGLKKHTSMNFTTEPLNERPKVNTIDIDHAPLVQGDNARFYITSKESKKVQYRVYLINKLLNTTQEYTNGYSSVIEGTSPFCIDNSIIFSSGGYELKVYVKRANANGIKNDNNTDYDDFKIYEFQCLTKNDLKTSYVVKEIITDASRYKIGQTINILQNVGQDTSDTTTLKAYKLFKEELPEELTSKIIWNPNEVGMYKLEATTKTLNGSTGDYLMSTQVKYIEVYNKEYIYQQYNYTLEEIVNKEYNCTTKQVNFLSPQIFSNAYKQDIKEYLDPKKIEEDDNGIYQFLTLNYIKGITAEDLNKLLGGKLAARGQTFLDACEKYDVNPAYVIAHTILETGNGTSELANGIEVKEVDGKPVESKMTYNMFGIGAVDKSPNKLGAEKAYKEGWFTVEAAIEGGIKYISSSYINNEAYKQNTLYKIRWNPANSATHQYATDIGWAYKQISRMKQILDKCANANLVFEIPQYK
jgi:beta-N-acetylglucosaminidase